MKERHITIEGELATVQFPYHPALVAGVKTLAGARYNGNGRHWTVNAAPQYLPRLLAWATDNGFSIEGAPKDEPAPLEPAPLRRALFAYQVEGRNWLMQRSKALLADDMGLGKTAQAIAALPPRAKAIVVCPALVKRNWANEILAWRSDLTPIVIDGRGTFRAPSEGEVIIVNYDILPPSCEKLANTYLIADEAHYLKSFKAQRSKRFSILSKSCSTTWLLTGTPLLSRPTDLYAILAAGQMRPWSSMSAFRYEWGGHQTRFEFVFDPHPKPAIAQSLKLYMLRRMKSEVLQDLPQKVYSTRTVEVKLSSPKELLELATQSSERRLTSPEVAKLALWRTECAAKKIPAMLEIVEEFEEEQIPLVVFSAFRAPIDALATRDGWRVITGDVSHEERAAIVAEFQSGKLRGIALTIAAGGVGITLTHASNLLFVDRDWNPSSNAQAEDRCNRIGQTATSVQAIDLVADNAIDKAVSASIAKKQDWFSGSVNEVPNAAPLVAAPEPKRSALTVTVAGIQVGEIGLDELPTKELRQLKAMMRAREAQTPQEEHANKALQYLASADSDRASARNGIGFNRVHNVTGHSLASQLRDTGKLTDAQWVLAKRIANTYKSQLERAGIEVEQ